MERRAYRRENIELPAQLKLGDCLVDGKICDYSAGGCFFYPEVGYIDGRFVHTDDVVDSFKEGDILNVVVFASDKSQPEFTIPSQIKWLGYNGRHGCGGFGLQNQATILQRAA